MDQLYWTTIDSQTKQKLPDSFEAGKKGPMHGDVCTGNNGISAAGNPQGLRANLCQTTTGELELWMEQMKLDLEQDFRFSICPLCPCNCCQDRNDPGPKL